MDDHHQAQTEKVSNTVRSDVHRPELPGVRSSFDILYDQHSALLRGIALKRGVPLEDADELVQEVFATYLVNPSRVQGDLRKYLIGGICNAIRAWRREELRKGMVFRHSDDDLDEIAASGPDRDTAEAIARSLVVAQLWARIGSRCRSLLWRYYLEKEPIESIAADVSKSKSVGTVSQLLHSCRKRARQQFEILMRDS